MMANHRQAGLDVMQARELQLADGFPARVGDLIDDRIAEMLDERDARTRTRTRRLSPVLAVLGFLFALLASLLLRHSALAVCTIWPSTAAVCLAARTTTPGRR
jgi:hypothetical protein